MQYILVDSEFHGQRIDNFLFRMCKGIPKDRVYHALRSGEIRVCGKRVKPSYRIQSKDEIRMPLRSAQRTPSNQKSGILESSVVQETAIWMMINKPSGIPVHGGCNAPSGGVIETMRFMRPQERYLELAHRIDRDTSGYLLLIKKRSILLELHASWRTHVLRKYYLALLHGQWQQDTVRVCAPLKKNYLLSGERMVVVDPHQGKPAETIFRPIRQFNNMILVEAMTKTGRTHQVRVHAAHLGHPIVGDAKYGTQRKTKNAQRLCLHATYIQGPVPPELRLCTRICAAIPKDFSHYIRAQETAPFNDVSC